MFKRFRHLSIRTSFVIRHSALRHSCLSHKRNSKDFDRANRPAAISSHDEIPKIDDSWANNSAGIRRERFSADGDQRRGRDVSVSDLLKVVRCIREGRSVRAIQLPIDRLRRRPETNPLADRRFRRIGWADER